MGDLESEGQLENRNLAIGNNTSAKLGAFHLRIIPFVKNRQHVQLQNLNDKYQSFYLKMKVRIHLQRTA